MITIKQKHTPQHNKAFTQFVFLLALFWVAGTKPSAALTQSQMAPILSQLDQHIKTQLQTKMIPGCAVAIVYQNKVIFMQGYGFKNIGGHERIDADTVFQLGSVSKPIAATLASILENKGLLKLDAAVTHYLPNFALRSSQSSHHLKITHILSHSSGVPRGGFNNLIEAHQPYDTILRALQRIPIRTAVGKRYDYNNAMFSLISDITKSATRSSFKDALHFNLLQPLNMTKTTSTLNGLLSTPNKAMPHIRNSRGKLVPCDTYSKGYYSVAPAGGINSSVRDMSIFLRAQLGGHPEVLNARTLSRLHTPHVLTNATLGTCAGPANLIKNARYGLGWRVVDFAHHKLVFHGGWLKGFTNFIGFMPDQNVGIVILHNGETRFSSKTAVKFFELFLGVAPKKKLSTLLSWNKRPKPANSAKKIPSLQVSRWRTAKKTLSKAKVVKRAAPKKRLHAQ